MRREPAGGGTTNAAWQPGQFPDIPMSPDEAETCCPHAGQLNLKARAFKRLGVCQCAESPGYIKDSGSGYGQMPETQPLPPTEKPCLLELRSVPLRKEP